MVGTVDAVDFDVTVGPTKEGGAARRVGKKPNSSIRYKPIGRRMLAFGKERMVWVKEGNKTDLFAKVKHRTENRFVYKKLVSKR